MAIYKSDIVDVELENGNIDRSFLKHSIGSGDSDANRFGVRAFRGGVPQDLTGASIQGIFMNAAGVNIALTSYGTVDGNVAYVTLPQACYNVEGQFTLALKLVKSGVTVTGRIVDGVVDNTGTVGTVAPTESVPTYQEIIAQFEEMVTATEAAEAAAQNLAIAVTFNPATAYNAGKYVMYNGVLYRLTADHAANVPWSETEKVAVNIGNELTALNTATEDLPEIRTNITALQAEDEKLRVPLEGIVNKYGSANEAVIVLHGVRVPYRYTGTDIVNTQESVMFTLPENVKTVDITLPTVNNINSYTFLDENSNIIFYKKESTTSSTPTTYTNLNAWEARYLVCGNNSTYANDITVTAKIKGVELYIDEAKKATGGEQLTLLHGTPKSTYYNLFTEYNGNYSVEYDVTGYDYADITSYNHTTTNNKYTMFDANGNIIGFYQIESGSSDIGRDTTIRVAIPTNAAKLWVGTPRAQRPRVAVYGVKMPDDFGWVNMGGVFVDYYYHQYLEEERANGSKEFPAQEFDILRLANGVTGQGINTFTAFDENGDVVGFMSLSAAEAQEKAITGSYFICPKGTVKVAIAAGNINQGLNRTNAIVAQKRKTGKKLSVMGDSISTYKNFIPDGNATYYEDGNRGVPTASYTWWGVVAREKGYQISTVQAWSGSKVSAPNGETNAMSGDRAGQLAAGGTPDIIIIYGGVNDFLQAAPLGTWDGHADIPSTATKFRDAYALMLNKIHLNYPLARVYCCTIANCNRDGTPNNLENIGGQWLHEFNSAIRQIAMMFNCTVIEVESCGINQQNLETYMGDFNSGTGSGLHPNQYGHALFAKRILEVLERN